MKKLYLIGILFIASCTNNVDNNLPDSIKDSSITTEKSPTTQQSYNFVFNCDNLEVWYGGIQPNPSGFLLLLGSCNDNGPDSIYEIALLPLSKTKDDLELYNAKKDSLPKYFDIYVFTIPTEEPKEPENEFDIYDYIFPNNASAYKYENKKWVKIAEEKVSTFEEYGRFKIATLKKEENIGNTHLGPQVD